jgi:formamidopyrimidine-DNA glycosylase
MGKAKRSGRERQPEKGNLGMRASLHEKSAGKVCRVCGSPISTPQLAQIGENICCEVY